MRSDGLQEEACVGVAAFVVDVVIGYRKLAEDGKPAPIGFGSKGRFGAARAAG